MVWRRARARSEKDDDDAVSMTLGTHTTRDWNTTRQARTPEEKGLKISRQHQQQEAIAMVREWCSCSEAHALAGGGLERDDAVQYQEWIWRKGEEKVT